MAPTPTTKAKAKVRTSPALKRSALPMSTRTSPALTIFTSEFNRVWWCANAIVGVTNPVPWICHDGLSRYFTIPKSAKQIWAVTSTKMLRDSYRIEDACFLTYVCINGINVGLTSLFYRFLFPANSTHEVCYVKILYATSKTHNTDPA